MAQPRTVLVVDDERTIADVVARYLERDGYRAVVAHDGEEAVAAAERERPDIVVLDVMLPRLDGLQVMAVLRRKRPTPVILLTARGDEQERVNGLKLGADDYVVKPFNVEELLARVDALLRRAGGWAQSEVVCGPILLDTRTQEVKVKGEKLELTSFEYKLLEYLMLHAGEVLSKTQITEALYEEDFERDSNVIEVFIGRLRKKLDPQSEYKPIETLRGRGYRLAIARGTPDTA